MHFRKNREHLTFLCDVDVCRFPFDEQTFQFLMRTDFPPGEVVFIPYTIGSVQQQRQLQRTTELNNPTFYLNGWSQTTMNVRSGVYSGGLQLQTSIHAGMFDVFFEKSTQGRFRPEFFFAWQIESRHSTRSTFFSRCRSSALWFASPSRSLSRVTDVSRCA